MNKTWVLESGQISEITRSKVYFEELVQFHWLYYAELAFQRNKIREQIKEALREKANPYDFSKWQRIVRYKHSLTPLSAVGSLTEPGGRFNVGQLDSTRYPMFAALYIAGDKGTALAEVLGRDKNAGSLSPEELALTKPDSISAVSVSGKLDAVLDVRDRTNLTRFVNLVKHFKVSPYLRRMAKRLHFPLNLVTTPKQLGTVLEAKNWRNWPMVYDVPAVSQIFGGLVMNAGIEGILYNSSITGKACLAIFPQTLVNSSSFVELDDAPPSREVKTRIDSSNFREFI
ncbi:MAG TPA: RES family NAD+ phosphorylase [Candidatus Sulfotelmatobacter sp.]|nr:RES family NAD+ phosphorylase [Candidatus Sulfotelmatobacter sp.]